MSCRDRAIATALAVLALGLGAAALLAEMTAAAWPGGNGPIVYLGVRPETSNTACCSPYITTGLRVVDPDDPGSTRVLTVDRSDADPQISPVGHMVVFTREVPSGPPFPAPATVSGIFVLGLDGGGLRQLTAGGPEGESDFKPAFHPSGEAVVFARGRGATGENDLYSIRLDGTGLRQITNGPAREEAPSVSPNGRRKFPRQVGYASPAFAPGGGSIVAVARPGAGPRLVRIRLHDPRHPRTLIDGSLGSAPVWVPG